jgi:hypothetical protein
MTDISKKLAPKLSHTTHIVLNFSMERLSMELSVANIIRKSRFFTDNHCPIMLGLRLANWFSSRGENIAPQETGRYWRDGTLADLWRRSAVKRPHVALRERLDKEWTSVWACHGIVPLLGLKQERQI